MTLATWNTDVLAIQNGTEVANGSTDITYYDTISADAAGNYTTKFIARGIVGTEIGYLYVLNSDGTYGKVYEQAGEAAVGKFVYDAASRAITFSDDDAPVQGDTLACAYTFKSASNAQKIVINSDGVPPVVLVSAYGIARDTCTGELFPCVVEGQAQVDGNWNFDLSADGEPVVQSLAMEFVKGCLSKELYTFTVFTEDEDIESPETISLSVPTGDILGKDASALASSLSITDAGKVEGTLNYVEGYTGFSSIVSEQAGYYFPFKIEVPAEHVGAEATVQVNNKTPKDIDLSDGTVVIYMGKDEATARGKTIKVHIDWDGPGGAYPTEDIVFDMREVIYAAKA